MFTSTPKIFSFDANYMLFLKKNSYWHAGCSREFQKGKKEKSDMRRIKNKSILFICCMIKYVEKVKTF